MPIVGSLGHVPGAHFIRSTIPMCDGAPSTPRDDREARACLVLRLFWHTVLKPLVHRGRERKYVTVVLRKPELVARLVVFEHQGS